MDERAVFLEVAERGSFRAAADHLDISVSYASRRIRSLEERLGVELFARTTRRVDLTVAGREYYTRLAPLWKGLQTLECEIGEDPEPSGTLTVAAPLSFGLKHVQPLINAFLATWPEVVVDASFSDRRVDPLDYDVTIRGGFLEDSSLRARKLLDMRGTVAASPDWIATHGMPTCPSDLDGKPAVTYTAYSSMDGWVIDGRKVRPIPRYRADNGDALLDAATRGLGVAYQPDFLMRPAVADGRLVELLPGLPTFEAAFWAIHRQQNPTATTRAFVDALVAGLAPG